MPIQIPLTQGFTTLVDEADAVRVQAHKWCVRQSRNGKHYAGRHQPGIPGGICHLHRWLLAAPMGTVIDHINGDALDNRRCNIRICHQSENLRNCKVQRSNTTGYRGVSPCSQGGFRAQIKVAGKKMWLGRYVTARLAAEAYDAASVRYHGDFGRRNFGEATGNGASPDGAA